jgi:hypothetical protein
MKKTLVVLIIGGLLLFLVACEAYSNVNSNSTSVAAHPSKTMANDTRSHESSTISTTLSVTPEGQTPILNEIQLMAGCNKILITDDFPASTIWKPISLGTTLSEVLSWLKGALVYQGNLPTSSDSAKNAVFHANIWPSALYIYTSDNRTISIQPYMYLKSVDGNLQKSDVENVLTLSEGDTRIYIQSSQLYDWLKNNRWQATFERLTSLN